MAKCCDLPAGERRTLVVVNAPVVSPDGLRGEIPTWVLLRNVWAKVEFKSGREPYDRDALREEATYRFSMDFGDASDITVEHQFVVEGIPYNIRSVENLEFRNKVMYFVADRGVTQ